MLAAKKPTCSYLCKSLRRQRPYSTPSAQTISKSVAKTNNSVVNCNAQITNYGRSGNIREAEAMFRRMPEKSIVTHTAMLSAYANNGEITSARKVFDEMPQRTVATWNAMITAYVRNMKRVDDVEEALRLFLRMPVRNSLSYAAMVMGLVDAGRFDYAERLYKSTPLECRDPFCSNLLMNGYMKSGELEEAVRIFDGMVERNVASWSSMVDGFCKRGRVDEARELFDLMEVSKNEFTWCSMIDGYMKVGRFEDGFRLFLQMRREDEVGIQPTILTVVFESCGRIGRCREGFQVHGLLSRLGFEYDVFLSNSIIAMYSRFGFINEARKVFGMTGGKDLVFWNSILHGYVQEGRIEEVKKPTSSYVCKSLRRQRPYSTPTAQTISKSTAKTNNSIVKCNAQITKYGRSGNIREAESMFCLMPEKSVVTYTAMLSAYANNSEITRARKVFQEMPERSVETWNAMITAYVRNMKIVDDVEEAFRLFLRMPVRNALSYAAMIMGLVNVGRFDYAERLYKSTPFEYRDPFCSNVLMNGYLKIGKFEEAVRIFDGIVERNVVSWSSMVDGFCKKGRVDEARELFDLMEVSKNEVTWCSMVDGYMKVDRFEDGFRLFMRMRREGEVGIGPNILAVVFESCGRIGRCREGCQVHGLLSRLGFEYDVFLANSIITMYSRFGFINEARKVFDMTSEKDLVSWNSLLRGYVQDGRLEEANELFKKMDVKDSISWTTLITGFSTRGLTENCADLFCMMPEPDNVAWTAFISGFVNNEEHEEAIRWFNRMIGDGIRPSSCTLSILLSASASLASSSLGLQIHSFVIKLTMENDLSIQNSLVSMYSKRGSVDDANKIFKSITTPNIVSYNSMITGLAHNGYGVEALDLFKQLDDGGLDPTEVTFLGVLSASASLASSSLGLQIHSFVIKLTMENDLSIQNSLVSMYSKRGSVDDANKIFKSITTPNIVSYNSMITGLAHNGYGVEALDLFKQLVDGGLDPTEVTFLGVLSACTHVGLVEEGRHYFESMKTFFELKPGREHYACMVDLLGRAGLLDEALKLIESMPVEPHVGVWGALLGASRTHMRLDIAKLAAENICELEPDNATPYVVLSDIYGITGKKRDEEEMRLSQKLRGIKKSPGCSWITVKDSVIS